MFPKGKLSDLFPSNPSDPTRAPEDGESNEVLLIHPPPPRLALATPRYASQSPWRLFLGDAWIFIKTLKYLPNAVKPWKTPDDIQKWEKRTDNSGWRGTRDTVLLAAVSIVQVLCIVLVPAAWIALPGFVFAMVMTGLVAFTYAVLYITQGPRIVLSKASLENGERGYGKERWVFLNGVMTSHYGLQEDVDAITQVFGRPVVGIHNNSYGFLADILECLVQRCFFYDTRDVRIAYDHIRFCLLDPTVEKLVLIAHSQGGIIASLVANKLLADLPRPYLQKMEIYTFASAASSFNNPPMSKQINVPEEHGTVTTLNSAGLSSNITLASAPPDSEDREEAAEPAATFGHIEHYANELDPIPRWGVLHATREACQPRYAGAVFVRRGRAGHFFVAHYLGAMFPLDAVERARFVDAALAVDAASERARRRSARDAVVGRTAAVKRAGAAAGVGEGEGEGPGEGEGRKWSRSLDRAVDTANSWDVDEASGEVSPGGAVGLDGAFDGSVRGFSRLWMYLDG